MKRTHFSREIYDQSWNRHILGRRTRVKHTTMCGTVCDHTKATTDWTKVTCRPCLKRKPS